MEIFNLEISDEEKEEIEKVYRIIHANKVKLPEGDIQISKLLEKENFIVTEHILIFIQNLTKNYSITKNEIAQTAKSLDVDNNNFISENTFVKAMAKWIKSSLFYNGLFKNNLSLISGPNERKIFHYSLLSFFIQNINNEINDQFYFLLSSLQEVTDLDFVDFEQNLNKSAEEKILQINQAIDLLKLQAPIITYELNQEDTKFSALTKICDMLKIITFSRKQNELKLISQLLSETVNFILNNGIINIMEIILADQNNFCLECLKIVSYILASNVIQNEYYNLAAYFKNITTSQIFFNMEIIQRLIGLITSVMTPQEVKVQALTCLALYSKYHEGIALFLLNQGVVEMISNFIIENDITGTLEKISWFYAVLSTVHIQKIIISVHFSHIAVLIKFAMQFLKFSNEFVIKNGIHILRGLLPFCKIDIDLSFYVHSLFECIKWNNVNITKSILVAFRDMIYSNNESLIKELLRKDLLHVIINILGSNNNYTYMILNIIKQLAQKSYFLEIFDSSKQTIIFLLKMLGDTSTAKNYAIKIFKTIVFNASDMFVGLLVDQNIVRLIFQSINNFKENDEIFQILYNFKEQILNFSFLEDCLMTLIAILEKGNTFGGGNSNQFIKHFDFDCLEKFRTCLSSLFDKEKENKIFFKKSVIYRNRTISMGKFIYYFLEMIEKSQIINNNNKMDEKSRAYAEIKNIFAYKLFEINPEEDLDDIKSSLQIKIKCYSYDGYPRGTNFSFNVLKSLKYSDLRQMIQMKYGYVGPFYLHYEDNISNERRIIEDEDSYARSVIEVLQQSLKSNSDFSMKIIFQPFQNNYMSYSSSQTYSPLKNVEIRKCEICLNTSTIPYDPLSKGKSFICESCKRLFINSSYPQSLPAKPLNNFYSPSKYVGKQRYLSYEP